MPEEDDHVVRSLYTRMRERGESLPEAGAAMDLPEAEIARARERLGRLGLLHPENETPVEATAALARGLQDGHRLLDRLVEQHVRASVVARRYLTLPSRAEQDTHVEFFPLQDDNRRLQQRIDELNEMTAHEVAGMHPVAAWTRESLEAGLARSRASTARGVRVRSLHAQIAFSTPLLREFAERWVRHGIEVRATPVIPARMLIYDRHTAILQADPADMDAGALLVREGGLVRSLAAIYDYCWITASELGDVPRSSDASDLTDQQRAVLRLLADGAKDSAIARTLGVSTRTVTRVTGELTAMLGATSRFQAGVRAARLGWLD
ncbi:helix-turn-helix transcriptional regulator [Nonomuraea sp. SMC257]|uniref:Helix-turn-helix transcriptional regulator n=1 Tax=Nonomuraea montanisoli TaxID=2741721 RepID=A0A7Y6I3L3_9ACTN|nr:helix-turn-helix transcriptional regulator [Nonomuraea montanisoli]NUW29919.1 helix-turn-helix transcriptional regulator [Nonomuraea montanisoli]